MLNRKELLGQLEVVSKELFLKFAQEQDIARGVWDTIKHDEQLCKKIHQKKYSLLLPKWVGLLGKSRKVQEDLKDYSVLAVDGSQVYYDKHQGPACYLINIGSVVLNYNQIKSSVFFESEPHVFVISDENRHMTSSEFVNLHREEFELQKAWDIASQHQENSLVTFLDGTLIFFQLDSKEDEQKQYFFNKYLEYLQKFHEHKKLIVAYTSFPRSKELVNILKLALAQFDEQELEHAAVLDQLTDMDIAAYFLDSGYRSVTFESKAPISYLYPKELKPYFCYMHVGQEIVRLEFPAWIAQEDELVDQICKVALDQAHKGRGYPVALFEAHEQAVIKGHDRSFFYTVLEHMGKKHTAQWYQKSLKSSKKQFVPV